MKRIIGILIIALTLLAVFVLTVFTGELKEVLIAWGVILLLTVLTGLGVWLIAG